jgi:beta-galactosidase beta subunit
MRFISVRDLRGKSAEIWKRMARAIAAVEAMQMKSTETGKDRLSLDEINAEIQTERKTRSK